MMKALLILAIFTWSFLPGDEMNFTASTPAGKTVRNFLGINQGDSIDFIRWKLKIVDNKVFEIFCSYGISKANTNGFVNEQHVALKGTVIFNDGKLTLSQQHRKLDMLLLNRNIIHLLYSDGTMMVGNAGWSYTLNSTIPVAETAVNVKTKNIAFSDSIVFEGRTPCRGMEELTDNKTRAECYKKKWRVSLYKDNPAAVFGTYKIGTIGARTGKWKLKEHASGRQVYSLDLNNGNSLDLYPADENVVYIMDGKGGLMIGNHNFSYSLNRKNYVDH